MSDGEGGKNVGIFGALIAGLGILLAKGADDCARVGAVTAKGAAPLMDDAARVSARGAGHVAGATDDGLRAAGRGAGLADEAAHPFGNSARYGAGAGDDALGAASRTGDDWLGDGFDVATELVSSVDFDSGGEIEGVDPGPAQGPAGRVSSAGASKNSGSTKAAAAAQEGARSSGATQALERRLIEDPKVIAVVPSTSAGYERMFGVTPQGQDVEEMSILLLLLEQPAKDVGMKQLAEMLAEHRASNPVTILGYTDGLEIKLALPSGERVSDAELHEACLNVGMNCFVFACDEKVPADGEPCVRSTYFTWSIRSNQAKSGRPAMSLGRFARSLMVPPSAYAGPPMVLSRVARSPDGKLKLVRTRPKGSRLTP
jgi:hypothetical protein